MFRLLSPLLGPNRYLSAQQLLRHGPHCLEHMLWGSSFKSFYRDSFYSLRAEIYQVLRLALQHQLVTPKHDNSTMIITPPRPKVIIITRGGPGSQSPGARKLSRHTELQLRDFFQSEGAEVSICCDFSQLKTPSRFLEQFWDIDICVGVHGAGLSNCVFGREGMVVLEFQTYHNFGFDSFMKIAHMTRGQYLMYDVRNASVMGGKDGGGGIVVQEKMLRKIVLTALSLWRFSQDQLQIISDRMHPAYTPAPDLSQLHTWERDFSPDGGKIYTYRPPITGKEIAKQLFTGDLMVDFGRSRAYLDTTTKTDTRQIMQVFLDKYLQVNSTRKLSVRSSLEHPAQQHVHDCLRRLDRTTDRSNFVKGRANFHHIDGNYLYRTNMNHEELWIMFNPALFSSYQSVRVSV